MTGTPTARSASLQALKKALVAGYPIIAIDSYEEDQVLSALASFSKSVYSSDKGLTIWDLQTGIIRNDKSIDPKKDPTAALDSMQEIEGPGFFVCKDIVSYLTSPEIQRRLRNIHLAFRGQNKFLFILGSDIIIPPDLRKDIHLIVFSLPDFNELQEIFSRNLTASVKKGVENRLTPDMVVQSVVSLQGFTAAEAQYTVSKVLWGLKTIGPEILEILQNEKEQLARKEGILEYVRTQYSIDDIGGLQNLKNWLEKRRKLFTPEAAAAGIHPPRGLLMMGISGCGKSLSVKAISSLWNLPLFRLDMNQIYSGMFGSPEAAFNRAIRSVEAVAPAVLWIDEIEGGISSSEMKGGGTGSHIFSAFLTWMQEKSAQVFVAATANRIDLLPAEIIRKGRFDQVFFIDLPTDKEREDIFRVHLKRRGNDPDAFDLTLLSVATEYWNGAELEHVVEAAMVEAFNRGNQMMQDDLYNIIRGTVPLARTMAEQIKFIKGWASERAISASIPDKN